MIGDFSCGRETYCCYFLSAHWILEFYIRTKSSRRVDHDELTSGVIRGLEIIGDIISGHPEGVEFTVVILKF